MDRNITIALSVVIITAILFIVYNIVNREHCPTNVDIHTERTTYKIGEEVRFSVNSELTIAKYEWDLAGEKTETINPTFTFDEMGTKSILVTINENCEYSKFIEIEDSATVAPIVAVVQPFKFSKQTAFVNDYIQFEDQSESVSALFWDFGDNKGTSELSNPSYSYKQPGTYTVTLMLNGDDKLTTTQTLRINRRTAPTPPPSPVSSTPAVPNHPMFKAKRFAYAGETIQFTDQTAGATTWLWNFGDGSKPATEQNPTHSYISSGNYTVELTTDNKTDKLIQVIKIEGNVVTASPTPSPTIITPISRPPIVPSTSSTSAPFKNNFQSIASTADGNRKKSLYKQIVQLVSDEQIPVEISSSGGTRTKDLYSYYQRLSITGGQTIDKVEVVSRDGQGKVTKLKVHEH